MAEKNRETFESRFWRQVEKGGPDECWRWLGIVDRDGYGIMPYARRNWYVQRAALVVDERPALAGQHACHRCGNAWCCNPLHIYAGTAKQNNADKVLHGTNLQGEQIYCAKLNEAQVKAIRLNNRPNHIIAAEYNVTPSNVIAIKKRKTWRHIQ